MRRTNCLGIVLLPTLVMVGLAAPIEAGVSFTNHCENSLSDGQLDRIRKAYELAYENRDAVFDEIARDRDELDLHNYTAIDEDLQAAWKAEMESVVVNCETSMCSNHDGTDGEWRFGRCNWPSNDNAWFVTTGSLGDRVIVCYDNLRRYGELNNNSLVAEVAGTIAHEIMHQVDGTEGHSAGDSDPSNPGTAAVTIGVAMAHLIISPDLAPSIDVETVQNGDEHLIELTVDVTNLNERSGTWQGHSGDTRNGRSVLTPYLYEPQSGSMTEIRLLLGGNSATRSFSFTLPVFEPGGGVYEIGAEADSSNALAETDETNNFSLQTLDLRTDLAVSRVEIAGPYTEHLLEFVNLDSRPPGIYSWRTLSYLVEIENVHSRIRSVPVDVVLLYDDMWSASDVPGRKIRYIPALDPGETATVNFDVDVQLLGLGNTVAPTELRFIADSGEETVNDRDRTNNVVTIQVDDDYFRPDYEIRLDSFIIDDDAYEVELGCTVRNLGAETADTAGTIRLDLDGDEASTRSIPPLEPAESRSVTLRASGFYSLFGKLYQFLVTADPDDEIDETDEENNVVLVEYMRGIPWEDLRDHMLFDEVPEPEAPLLQQEVVEIPYELIDNLPGSLAPDILGDLMNGEFLPDLYFNQATETAIEIFQPDPVTTRILFVSW